LEENNLLILNNINSQQKKITKTEPKDIKPTKYKLFSGQIGICKLTDAYLTCSIAPRLKSPEETTRKQTHGAIPDTRI
jgi:hypothetical protein